MLTFYAGFFFFYYYELKCKDDILKFNIKKETTKMLHLQSSSLSYHVDYFAWTISAILSMHDTNLKEIIKSIICFLT